MNGASEMRVVYQPDELRSAVHAFRAQGLSTGLVPTMGALHAGHLSLVAASRDECDATVATIFVNPTQFGPQEDLARYPQTLEADLAALQGAGVAVVFVPTIEAMYPPGCSTSIQPPRVAQRWEGECRPGHFGGVATVVLKLFQMAPTDVAFFGQKDFQQARVIQDMARDLDVPMQIRVCPIIREQDGLAMSSRNRYLSAEQRQRALFLSRTLDLAQQQVASGQADAVWLRQQLQDFLAPHVDPIDYVALADPATLEPIESLGQEAVLLLAAHVGGTRLIDNRVLRLAGNR